MDTTVEQTESKKGIGTKDQRFVSASSEPLLFFAMFDRFLSGLSSEGASGDFQNLNKCRGCRPLTPSRPKGGLVSLQLPESEQDQGFDH